jgi:hypothetical protein
MWIAACFMSYCLISSVGLAFPRLMVAIADQSELIIQ